METHRKLTYIGMLLLVITFAVNYFHEQTHPEEFNFAYIPGIAMIVVFMGSFLLFNKGRWRK